MSSINDSAYPRFKSSISEKELAEVYTPTDEELIFAESFMRNSSNMLGFFILLKSFQRLGRFVPVLSVPQTIIKYIANCLGQPSDMAALSDYARSRVKWDHIQKIREFLQIKLFNNETKGILREALCDSAKTKEDIVDIINAGIEEMVRNRCELPTFDTLVREAKRARAQSNAKIYRQVYESIRRDRLAFIDLLLHSDGSGKVSAWETLREDTGKPTLKTARKLLKRMGWLHQFDSYEFNQPIDDIPYLKFRHLAMEARSLDAARVRSITETKRCTMVAALIRATMNRTVDDLCKIMIKKTGKIHWQAKEKLREYLEENQEKQEEIVFCYKEIYDRFTGEGTDEERLSAIQAVFDDRPDLVEYSNHHLESAGKNHFRFLWSAFKSSRAVFFNILSDLTFISTSEDTAIEQAIEFAKAHRNIKKDWILLSSDQKRIGHPPIIMDNLSWIPDNWWKFVTGQKHRQPRPNKINRRNFELCLFSQIVLSLKSSDLCVKDSEQYADYRHRFVSWDEYYSEIDRYGERVGLPIEKKKFTNYLKALLRKEASDTDNTYTDNQEFQIDNKGIPSLKKLKAVPDPEGLKIVEAQLLQRLTLQPRNILDVLADTQNSIDWARAFGPVSGLQTKLKNPSLAYIVATFCYGCLLGPSQTERSLPLLDRRQISWINQRHVTEENIQKAIEIVVNSYNKFALPKYWGDGSSVSADGTKWDLYENNLLSEYHIRYGGYGGIAYYHVSDKYIALFSRFIPCGVYEAIYILDALFENMSEIQPKKLHADTHGQSLTVFGLAFLLGIQLMPRIRNWKGLNIFKADPSFKYNHIDSIFTDDGIDWELIEKHLPDMFRIAISIQKGKVSASAVLRRIGSFSRKNKLYFAFQELGKVVRSIFLLQYIRLPEMRRTINHATTVSEAFNEFIQWLGFGNNGVITENSRDEQRKIIKYSHLVANILIFMNVFDQTKVLQDLVAEGYNITPEILACLSPFRTAHVNRFGKYDLDENRPRIEIDYGDILISPAVN